MARINGDDSANVLRGTKSKDTINGHGGDDQIWGGGDADTINGGDGHDLIHGEAGNDLLYGNAGNDTIYGGLGDDFFGGQQGNDILYGDAGNDRIFGDDGHDSLHGGDGSDWLRGFFGSDQLYGGGGADTFSFFSQYDSSATGYSGSSFEFGIDTIHDFEPGIDKIDLAQIDANGTALDGNGVFALVDSADGVTPGHLMLTYDATAGITTIYGYTDTMAGADFTLSVIGSVNPADFIF